MCNFSETKTATNDNIDFSTINDDFKDAIFSCAREEISRLIRELVTPKSINNALPSHESASRKHLTKTTKFPSCRKLKLSKDKSSNNIERPTTAYSISPSVTKVYEPQRTKSFSNIGYMREKRIRLSAKQEMPNFKSPLSFVTTQLIEKSAKMIDKSCEEVCRIEATKTGKFAGKIGQRADDKCHTLMATTVDVRKNINYNLKRPNTSYTPKRRNSSRISKRIASDPTTALERRAPLRPSTAHLVRAKTEGFSQNLLRPITLKSPNEISTCIPLQMGEHEWENELARHIVSVYNNKIVSDIQDAECLRTLEDKGVSRYTQEFLDSTSQSDLEGESCPKHNNRHIATSQSKDKILRQTKKLMNSSTPRMVWIGGADVISHGWDELEGTISNKILRDLYREGHYTKYIMVLKSQICSKTTEECLWRKLILCANSFASKLIEERKYTRAIELLEIATDLISTGYIHSESYRLELSGLLQDTHAYYYSRRGKPSAALQCIISASNTEKQRIVLAQKNKTSHVLNKTSPLVNLARFHLHRARILQQLHRFSDAMKYLQRILSMVDTHLQKNDDIVDGKLYRKGIAAENTEIIILVAVAHHNIAVIQILMGHIGDACISSQNCRKLSRMCMSVSSRYISQFEETHMKALCGMSSMLRKKQTKEEALVFQKLVIELFD